jgi:hypothetical protein
MMKCGVSMGKISKEAKARWDKENTAMIIKKRRK